MARGVTREERGGGYRLRWRDPDGTRRSWTCHDLRTAVLLEEEIQACRSLGRRWEPRDASPVPSLDDALTAYTARCARVLALSTAVRYGHSLDLYRAFVDDPRARVSVLSRASLAGFFAWLRTSPIPRRQHARTVSTARKTVEHIGSAWAWLYDSDEYGPHVERPRSIEMPEHLAQAVIAPTWEEADACVLACADEVRVLATVLRYTGLRISQAMRLEWADLDLDRACLTIRPELGKSRREKLGRTIPISLHLVAYLAGLGQRVGLVVPLRGKAVPLDRVLRPRALVAAWEASGVRPEVWRGRPAHAFRRGLTSGLARAGADREAVEYLVGHALPGARGQAYLDPIALPLVETVALIPAVGAGLLRLPKKSDTHRKKHGPSA